MTNSVVENFFNDEVGIDYPFARMMRRAGRHCRRSGSRWISRALSRLGEGAGLELRGAPPRRAPRARSAVMLRARTTAEQRMREARGHAGLRFARRAPRAWIWPAPCCAPRSRPLATANPMSPHDMSPPRASPHARCCYPPGWPRPRGYPTASPRAAARSSSPASSAGTRTGSGRATTSPTRPRQALRNVVDVLRRGGRPARAHRAHHLVRDGQARVPRSLPRPGQAYRELIGPSNAAMSAVAGQWP